uniref:Reverse transcriptase domain-containing protein n=1 Tax=Cannabis sativa TaxID=3483 RepID=A0A803NFP5_CANSA
MWSVRPVGSILSKWAKEWDGLYSLVNVAWGNGLNLWYIPFSVACNKARHVPIKGIWCLKVGEFSVTWDPGILEDGDGAKSCLNDINPKQMQFFWKNVPLKPSGSGDLSPASWKVACWTSSDVNGASKHKHSTLFKPGDSKRCYNTLVPYREAYQDPLEVGDREEAENWKRYDCGHINHDWGPMPYEGSPQIHSLQAICYQNGITAYEIVSYPHPDKGKRVLPTICRRIFKNFNATDRIDLKEPVVTYGPISVNELSKVETVDDQHQLAGSLDSQEIQGLQTEQTSVQEEEESLQSARKSWADEVDHFQAASQSHWQQFSGGKVLNSDAKLSFTEPLINEGRKIAHIDLEDVKLEEESWKSAVICMVLGANIPAVVFEGFVRRIWGHLGIVQVARMTKGLTMVKFNDEATRDEVLENGMIHFDKKPVIIRPWSADLNLIMLYFGEADNGGQTYQGSNTSPSAAVGNGENSAALAAESVVAGTAALAASNAKEGRKKRAIKAPNDDWQAPKHKVWRKGFVQVEVEEESNQHVHCRIKMIGQQKEFFATFIYRANSIDGRLELWRCLSGINISKAWIILGDFNAVFNHEDRGEEIIGCKPFKFYNFWIDHKDYKQLVMDSWNRPIRNHGLKGVFYKTMRLKHKLKAFNKSSIGDIGSSYDKAKAEYKDAQSDLQAAPLDSSKIEREKLAAKQGSLNDHFPEVVQHFLNHFQNIMGKENPTSRPVQQDCIDMGSILTLDQQNQGAFVKGRSIAYNILILQDLLKNYKRKNCSPRCTVKIDISKAYDTVNWDFLEKLLNLYCFPTKFITWIMLCVRNTSYTLVMNGRLQGAFKGEQGLRQGDPISPLLFVLIMEYLSRRFQLAAKDKRFRYHPLCKKLKLTNLCFADDLVIFCKGNEDSIQVIREVLEDFGKTSDITSAGAKGKFRASKLYNSLILQQPDPAARAIWCGLNVPKQSFILWQTAHSNLLTRDKLALFHITAADYVLFVVLTLKTITIFSSLAGSQRWFLKQSLLGWDSVVGLLILGAGTIGFG